MAEPPTDEEIELLRPAIEGKRWMPHIYLGEDDPRNIGPDRVLATVDALRAELERVKEERDASPMTGEELQHAQSSLCDAHAAEAFRRGEVCIACEAIQNDEDLRAEKDSWRRTAEAARDSLDERDNEYWKAKRERDEARAQLDAAKRHIAELYDADMPGVDHAADVAALIDHSNIGWGKVSDLYDERERLRAQVAELTAELELVREAAEAVSINASAHTSSDEGLTTALETLDEALDATTPEHRGEALRADRERVVDETAKLLHGIAAQAILDSEGLEEAGRRLTLAWVATPNPYAKPEPDEGGGS